MTVFDIFSTYTLQSNKYMENIAVINSKDISDMIIPLATINIDPYLGITFIF